MKRRFAFNVWLSRAALAIALGGALASAPSLHAAQDGARTPKKLVFAIDGLSYESFQIARAQGLFKAFGSAGRHIAPYPSMSEPSWTEIMGGRLLFPQEGNVKTIEAKYFDIDSMSITDDPRLIFHRYTNPYNFTRSFDYLFNPILEGLMYFPGDKVADMEIEQLEKEIYDNFTGDHYVAYVSSVDATAHTQVGRLYPLLVRLNAAMERILEHYRAAGVAVDAWIVSDHGNVGRFKEGEAEEVLLTTNLDAALMASNLVLVDGAVTRPNEVAIPIMALGSMGNVYFKDLSRRRLFATNALMNGAVELVTWVEASSTGSTVMVLGKDGDEAHITWSKTGYSYVAVRGNPLQIDPKYISKSAQQEFPDAVFRRATQDGKYPDSVFRLVESARKQVTNAPDLIINIRDGFCFEGPFSKYVKMVRTHGSLTAASSLGLVAANHSQVPASLRSGEILSVIGLTPAQAFIKWKPFSPIPAGELRTGEGSGAERSCHADERPIE